MNNKILDRLSDFIHAQGFGYKVPFPFLFKKKIIIRETKAEDDLGIYGDDADEFLMAFSKEFNVDISNFPIGSYFSDEGDIILPAIIRFLTNKKRKERKNLTVGDLEKAILAGRLDEEVINS
jgi:uncharacterized protein DUF1493